MVQRGGNNMIAIVDYDAGNLKSVEKAFQSLGEECIITRNREEILNADRVVLPGVGSFGDAMEKLNKYNLNIVLHEVVDQGKPLLGICLGLQLFFEFSDETPGVRGLSLLEGEIISIPPSDGLKIPHMGWNSLKISKNSRLFQSVPEDSYVYFVHSYYLQAKEPEVVAATTEYSVLIHAAVEHKNIYACQFHPEKSGDVGLQILKNFASL